MEMILEYMARLPQNRVKFYELNEAGERVHVSALERLARLRNSVSTKKKKKIKLFTGCSEAREIECCNETKDVDSKDGLDTGILQKENNNEAIDLDPEGSRGSRTIQDKICKESTDVDTEVKHSVNSAEKDLTDRLPNSDACCQACMIPENCAYNSCAFPDHFVSGNHIGGEKFVPARSPNYQVSTPCSKNDVSIYMILDDDERTEMNSSYVSSPQQNGVLLRVPGNDFARHSHKFYPKGEHDDVTISQREIELLQPKKCINDNIIDFYINHLKSKIKPDERQRFHFFNCFFFRKLVNLDKKSFGACQGRADFERVRKWTKEVDLFEKDFIFIPVNFNSHWSLVVVCHPGEVVTSKDEEVEKSPKVPCILHMNSIKGSHSDIGLENIFQSYICELWKEKHDVTAENISSKFLHLKFIQLELPQQENLYDCGLFLLHYVELFLREAPVNFNPLFRRAEFSNFLTKNWFPPDAASRKRAEIRELINGKFKNGYEEGSPADCSIRYSSSQISNANKQAAETVIDEETCRSTDQCHVSIPRSVKCIGESSSCYNRLLHPGSIAKPFSDDKYSTMVCQLNMMPSIEDLDEEGMESGSSYFRYQNSSKLEKIKDSQSQERKSPSTSSEHEVYFVEDSDESDDMQEN